MPRRHDRLCVTRVTRVTRVTGSREKVLTEREDKKDIYIYNTLRYLRGVGNPLFFSRQRCVTSHASHKKVLEEGRFQVNRGQKKLISESWLKSALTADDGSREPRALVSIAASLSRIADLMEAQAVVSPVTYSMEDEER
jgi:hypothetical protein